jgi:hypothetical protein
MKLALQLSKAGTLDENPELAKWKRQEDAKFRQRIGKPQVARAREPIERRQTTRAGNLF